MAALTPEANRAARAILKWSVRELADHAGVAFSTVHRFEATGLATETTKDKIKAAYALYGVGDNQRGLHRRASAAQTKIGTGVAYWLRLTKRFVKLCGWS